MPPPDEPARWWTAEEANAALSRVTELVGRAREAMGAVAGHRRDVVAVAKGNGHARSAPAAHDLQTVLDELAADGIVLRDADRGLIDFPARAPSGRAYWLCWLVGEPAVDWWHWPEDGFAGRTPLSDPPR